MATSGSFEHTMWSVFHGMNGVGSTYTNKAIFTWSVTSTISGPNPQSTISWTMTPEGRYDNVGARKYDMFVKIDGVQVETGQFKFTNDISGSASGAFSGVTTLSHNANGVKSFVVEIGTTSYTGSSSSQSFTLDPLGVPATLTAAPNFNDEENPVISYSNPSGELVNKVQACIEWFGGAQTISYRDVVRTQDSYTFELTDAERKVLRQGITSGNTRSIRFSLRTLIGDTYYFSQVTRTFSLINYTPTLNPTVYDINPHTISLTGSNSILVRYMSDAAFESNAAARKEATLVSGYVENGTQLINEGLSNEGLFYTIETNKFKFGITDSRGYTTTKEIKTSWVPYIKPTCSLSLQPLTLAGTMNVICSGVCYNGNFGAKSNSLKFKLRVLKNGKPIIPDMDSNHNFIYGNAGEMVWLTPSGGSDDWFILKDISVSYNGHSYTATYNLTGLDIGDIQNPNTFTIQANVIDELTNAQTKEMSAISKPIFDWGKTDFQFNVPVYLKDSTIPLENLKDYVILQGTVGGYDVEWFYRQWHSGKVELFGTLSIQSENCNTALGSWYRTPVISSPAFPFTVLGPQVTATYESNGYGALIWPTTQSSDSKPFDFYLICPTSGTVSGVINYHVIGRHGGQIA